MSFIRNFNRLIRVIYVRRKELLANYVPVTFYPIWIFHSESLHEVFVTEYLNKNENKLEWCVFFCHYW